MVIYVFVSGIDYVSVSTIFLLDFEIALSINLKLLQHKNQQMAPIEGMQERHHFHTGCHQNYHVNVKTKQTITKYNTIANQSTTPDIYY